MTKLENGYIEFLPASQMRPLLRRELRVAYHVFAILKVNGFERMISHHPARHAPATKLPWPLSKLGIHDVAIDYFTKNGDMTESKRFTKDKIDVAIEEFLSGVLQNEEISINVEFS